MYFGQVYALFQNMNVAVHDTWYWTPNRIRLDQMYI